MSGGERSASEATPREEEGVEKVDTLSRYDVVGGVLVQTPKGRLVMFADVEGLAPRFDHPCASCGRWRGLLKGEDGRVVCIDCYDALVRQLEMLGGVEHGPTV